MVPSFFPDDTAIAADNVSLIMVLEFARRQYTWTSYGFIADSIQAELRWGRARMERVYLPLKECGSPSEVLWWRVRSYLRAD